MGVKQLLLTFATSSACAGLTLKATRAIARNDVLTLNHLYNDIIASVRLAASVTSNVSDAGNTADTVAQTQLQMQLWRHMHMLSSLAGDCSSHTLVCARRVSGLVFSSTTTITSAHASYAEVRVSAAIRTLCVQAGNFTLLGKVGNFTRSPCGSTSQVLTAFVLCHARCVPRATMTPALVALTATPQLAEYGLMITPDQQN